MKLVDGLKAVGVEAKLQGNAAQNAANQNNIHAKVLIMLRVLQIMQLMHLVATCRSYSKAHLRLS